MSESEPPQRARPVPPPADRDTDDQPKRPRRDEDDDRPRRERRERDDRDGRPLKPVPFPTTIRLAGLAWLVFGLIQLIGLGLNVAAAMGMNLDSVLNIGRSSQTVPQANQQPSEESAAVGGMVVGGVVRLCVALAFSITGVQAMRGTVTSVTGAGVVSLVLGGLGLAVLVAMLVMNGLSLQAVVAMLSVVLVLTGGICALVGAKQYRKWRVWKQDSAEEKTREARKARARRDDEDDDEEPRRVKRR